MEKLHFEQARIWLAAAQHTMETRTEQQRFAVAYAMVVHAIIKANDALTLRFFRRTARQHTEARPLFEDLVKQRHIGAQYAPYKQIIQDAIEGKAHAEYRGAFVSKGDYESLARKAEKFLKMVGEVLGE